MSTALASLAAAVRAAFPGIDSPRSAVMRLIRAVGPRVSLQTIALQDEAPEANPVEVWPGVPGVTSDPSEGEEVVLLFVGADQVPYVIGRGREGGPGSVPIRVRHDATNGVYFVTTSAGKVYIGPPGIGETARVPVAKAPQVDALKEALQAYCVAVAEAPTLLGIVAATAGLATALNVIAPSGTTRLESA